MKIKKNTMEMTLNDKLEECEMYIGEPIQIFKISNFLNTDSYQCLIKEIYSIKEFDRPFIGKGEKVIKTINGSNIGEINTEILKNFCNLILTKKFFYWFKKTHLPYFNKRY